MKWDNLDTYIDEWQYIMMNTTLKQVLGHHMFKPHKFYNCMFSHTQQQELVSKISQAKIWTDKFFSS